MSVTIKYDGQDITYEPIANWKSYCSSTDDGEASWDNLTQSTVMGLPALLGFLKAIGYKGIKITSGWRSQATNQKWGGAPHSQHLVGNAIDLTYAQQGEDSPSEVVSKIAATGENGTNANSLSLWAFGLYHDRGSGMHWHFDNYLGGMGGETDDQKKFLKEHDVRANGQQLPCAGTNNSLIGTSSASRNCIGMGQSVTIQPENKTFAEPVYPDLMYVAGNIPSAITAAAIADNNKKVASINTGTNTYKVLTGDNMQALTGLSLNGFTSEKAEADRQKVYDARKNISDFKVPSAGKPLNNNDPYPIDLKIEELELHQPRVKQNRITFRQIDNDKTILATSILTGLDHAEKRIVKLENVLATVFRYVMGTASRMFVNCIYYGGQDNRSKYACIRCMKDDRCQDGQVMQLDQCLSCSRYEPIFGKTYDITNELGANLADILDQGQMGYMNMQDFKDMGRTDSYPKPMKSVKFDLSTIKTRDSAEKDFKDTWDKGVRMKWKLVPVEAQKPIINWRMDINHPDHSPKKLASNQYNPSNAGQVGGADAGECSCSVRPGNYAAMMEAQYKYISTSQDPQVKHYYDIGEDLATGSGNRCINTIQYMDSQGWADELKNQCTEVGLDPLLILSIIAVESAGNEDVDQYASPQHRVYGVGQVAACPKNADVKTQLQYCIQHFLGNIRSKDGNNPLGPVQEYHDGSGNMEDGPEKIRSADQMYDANWIATLKSRDPHQIVLDESCEYFPKVCCSYHKFSQMSLGLSEMASDNSPNTYDFVFADSKLKDIYFISDYGTQSTDDGTTVMSTGITFKVPPASELHMSMAGTVGKVTTTEKGNQVTVAYGNNEAMVYTGIDSLSGAAQKNPNLRKSEVFAVSGSGGVLTVQLLINGTLHDPKEKWPSLNGRANTTQSLGAQIKQGKKEAATGDGSGNITVGGEADGAYDVNDPNNWEI